MSASNKKKLRKEQYAEKMTKRQQQEKAEAKKLKTYTIAFISALVAIVIFLTVVFSIRWYKNSGIAERKTIAATIGEYKMNTAEMAYYYNDAINEFYNQVYGSVYSEMFFESLGLDLTKSLDKQTNPETGDTWANYFIDTALDTAKSDFAMYNKAKEAGFKLSEEQQAAFDAEIKVLKTNTKQIYGGTNKYLKQVYGPGSDIKSYTKYLERKEIAEKFYDAYYADLTHTDEEIRAYEKDNYDNYNSYTYAYAYLSYKDFLEGGTKNESGTMEYTEEENNAAREKMMAAAESLLAATSVDELKEMIKEVQINESSQLAVNQATNSMHTSVSGQNVDLAAWLSDDARTEGEIGLVEVKAEVETEDQTEETETEETEDEAEAETVTNGCYVVIFQKSDDNTKFMSNVRHLLVKPDGGHVDDATGETVYTEAEQTVAYNDAKKLLDAWKSGAATEESFIEMVKEETADTASIETGGLYEDIHPHSEYMEAFRDWAVNPERKVGDTDIVETPHGQHIMYYVGDSEQTYRDYLISVDLSNKQMEEYYQAALDATVVTKKDMSKLNLSLVLAG